MRATKKLKLLPIDEIREPDETLEQPASENSMTMGSYTTQSTTGTSRCLVEFTGNNRPSLTTHTVTNIANNPVLVVDQERASRRADKRDLVETEIPVVSFSRVLMLLCLYSINMLVGNQHVGELTSIKCFESDNFCTTVLSLLTTFSYRNKNIHTV